MNKFKVIKLELSLIYMFSAMLILSLFGLVVNVAYSNSAVGVKELYPDLYCGFTPEINFNTEKVAYFTFDDGPSHNTEKILDILAKENVKATFFVCAQASDDADSPAILRRILEEGHEIGLHSCTHNYSKIYRSLESYLEDLNSINEYIIEATGYHASIMRFPGGSSTKHASPALKKEIFDEISRRGYRFYDWDIDSGDAITKSSSEKLASKIVTNTKDRNRVIILMHDNPAQKTTPEAVRLAIPELRKQGYSFDKLTASVDPENHYG